MYEYIINRWSGSNEDPTALLLRVLASVIYHFDWIQSQATALGTDHPFNSIPFMFKPELVLRLKGMITTKESSILTRATGIPPHVEQSMNLQKLFNATNECVTLLKSQVTDIKAVSTRLFIVQFSILWLISII